MQTPQQMVILEAATLPALHLPDLGANAPSLVPVRKFRGSREEYGSHKNTKLHVDVVGIDSRNLYTHRSESPVDSAYASSNTSFEPLMSWDSNNTGLSHANPLLINQPTEMIAIAMNVYLPGSLATKVVTEPYMIKILFNSIAGLTKFTNPNFGLNSVSTEALSPVILEFANIASHFADTKVFTTQAKLKQTEHALTSGLSHLLTFIQLQISNARDITSHILESEYRLRSISIVLASIHELLEKIPDFSMEYSKMPNNNSSSDTLTVIYHEFQKINTVNKYDLKYFGIIYSLLKITMQPFMQFIDSWLLIDPSSNCLTNEFFVDAELKFRCTFPEFVDEKLIRKIYFGGKWARKTRILSIMSELFRKISPFRSDLRGDESFNTSALCYIDELERLQSSIEAAELLANGLSVQVENQRLFEEGMWRETADTAKLLRIQEMKTANFQMKLKLRNEALGYINLRKKIEVARIQRDIKVESERRDLENLIRDRVHEEEKEKVCNDFQNAIHKLDAVEQILEWRYSRMELYTIRKKAYETPWAMSQVVGSKDVDTESNICDEFHSCNEIVLEDFSAEDLTENSSEIVVNSGETIQEIAEFHDIISVPPIVEVKLSDSKVLDIEVNTFELGEIFNADLCVFNEKKPEIAIILEDSSNSTHSSDLVDTAGDKSALTPLHCNESVATHHKSVFDPEKLLAPIQALGYATFSFKNGYQEFVCDMVNASPRSPHNMFDILFKVWRAQANFLSRAATRHLFPAFGGGSGIRLYFSLIRRLFLGEGPLFSLLVALMYDCNTGKDTYITTSDLVRRVDSIVESCFNSNELKIVGMKCWRKQGIVCIEPTFIAPDILCEFIDEGFIQTLRRIFDNLVGVSVYKFSNSRMNDTIRLKFLRAGFSDAVIGYFQAEVCRSLHNFDITMDKCVHEYDLESLFMAYLQAIKNIEKVICDDRLKFVVNVSECSNSLEFEKRMLHVCRIGMLGSLIDQDWLRRSFTRFYLRGLSTLSESKSTSSPQSTSRISTITTIHEMDSIAATLKPGDTNSPETRVYFFQCAEMIKVYAKKNDFNSMKTVYEKAIAVGFHPKAWCYSVIIRASFRCGQIGFVKVLWSDIKKYKINPKQNLSYLTMIMDACKAAGNKELTDYFEVEMKGLPNTFNESLALFYRTRQDEKFLKTFNEMKDSRVGWNAEAWGMFIRYHSDRGNLDQAKRIFREGQNHGFRLSVSVCNNMIKSCGKMGEIDEMMQIHNQMIAACLKPDSLTFHWMIISFAKAGKLKQAEELWREMLELGLKPGLTTYNYMINAHGKARNLSRMLEYFQGMIRAGLIPNLDAFNSMIDYYGKSNDLIQMFFVFNEMKRFKAQANDKTYISMIEAYARNGDLVKMNELLQDFLRLNLKLSIHPFNSVLNAYRVAGDSKMISETLKELSANGLNGNSGTFACVIEAYAKTGDLPSMLKFAKIMYESKFLAEATTLETILYACRNFGHIYKDNLSFKALVKASSDIDDVSLKHAIDALTGTPIFYSKPDSVKKVVDQVWLNSQLTALKEGTIFMTRQDSGNLIYGFAMLNDFLKMKYVYEQSKLHGFRQDRFRYSVMISTSFKCNHVEFIEILWDDMNKFNVAADISVFTAMIHAYGYSGNMEKVNILLNEMKLARVKYNLHTFGVLLTIYMKNCDSVMFAKTLSHMKNSGMAYNIVIINIILEYHAKNGDLFSMKQAIEQSKQLGLTLTRYSYASIMKGYGNAKEVDKMVDVYKEMVEAGVKPFD